MFQQEAKGELALWCGVLVQAIHDLEENDDGMRSIVGRVKTERAWAWIESNDCELGSFLWVCDQLGLDAEAVRARLKNWSRKSFTPAPELSHAPRSIPEQ